MHTITPRKKNTLRNFRDEGIPEQKRFPGNSLITAEYFMTEFRKNTAQTLE